MINKVGNPYKINDNCVACGLCVNACPIDAIAEGNPYVIDEEKCVGCGVCAEACPTQAIEEVT